MYLLFRLAGSDRVRAGAAGGFTLLEVVITVAILTTLTFSALLVIVPLARQSRISREVEIATAEARRVLEKVQAAQFTEITALYPDDTIINIPSLTSGQMTIDYDDPAADPLYFRLTLTWDSPDMGAMSRSFSTVRTE